MRCSKARNNSLSFSVQSSSSAPLKLDAKIKSIKVKGNVERVGIQADGEIDRKVFGLTWQKPGTGLLAKAAGKFVGDEVKIMVNLIGQPEKKK